MYVEVNALGENLTTSVSSDKTVWISVCNYMKKKKKKQKYAL